MSMIKPFSYSMAAVLLSSTSALAAACFDGSSTSCATVSGKTSDCLALGYSKDDVVGCKHYLLCPFDTSYKACVTQKYADPCEDGYVFINGECVKVYASCEDAGWKYSSIPANMHCDASTNIYLTNGTQKTCYSACSCNDGYVENASGECVKADSCPSGYSETPPAGPFQYDTTTAGNKTCYKVTGCTNVVTVANNPTNVSDIFDVLNGSWFTHQDYKCATPTSCAQYKGWYPYDSEECQGHSNTRTQIIFTNPHTTPVSSTDISCCCPTCSGSGSGSGTTSTLDFSTNFQNFGGTTYKMNFVCNQLLGSVTWYGTVSGNGCGLSSPQQVKCPQTFSANLTGCQSKPSAKTNYIMINGKSYTNGSTITIGGKTYKISISDK